MLVHSCSHTAGLALLTEATLTYFIACLYGTNIVTMMLGFTLEWKDDESHAQIRDNVVIYLLDVMFVISTKTKIIVVVIKQRQTQQNVLAGQAAVKQNPYLSYLSFIRVATSSRSQSWN